MERKAGMRRIALPLLFLSLTIWNYTQLRGTENVRLIHEVSLFVMGALFAVLIMNVVRYFRGPRTS